METGSIEELKLTRSVIKHVKKNDKALIQGPGVGNDFAAYKLFEGTLVCSEAVATNIYIAWVKAINNIVAAGVKPFGARITMLIGKESEEQLIKKYMSISNELAEKYNIQILGGHTQISSIYTKDSFCVTMYANSENIVQNLNKIKPGCDIVMAGYTGCMGADLIAKSKELKLCERFARSYIQEQKIEEKEYCLIDMLDVIGQQDDIYYMHDISTAGVYGALWQMGVRIKNGFEIDHSYIPIKQGTIEISEYFDINPYMLDGTGALLVVTDNGNALVEQFEDNNIIAAVIGKVTDNNDKIIMYPDAEYSKIEKRFLTPPKGDEIYKVLTDW